MTMQEFFSAISNFGFPVVVSAYLLFRFENKIEKLDKSVAENTLSNLKLVETINNLVKEVGRLDKR